MDNAVASPTALPPVASESFALAPRPGERLGEPRTARDLRSLWQPARSAGDDGARSSGVARLPENLRFSLESLAAAAASDEVGEA